MAKDCYTDKDYINLSGFLRTIFSNECEICKEKKDVIHIHHIDNKTVPVNLSNLMHVCSDCHKIVEKSVIDRNKHLELVFDKSRSFIKTQAQILVPSYLRLQKSYAFGHPLSDD